MRKNLPNILLLLVFMTGLSLLLYPTVSDYWNSFHQSKAIARYTELVANLDNTQYEELWKQAEDYNAALPAQASRFHPTEEQHEEYEQLLNVGGSGIMAYLEIPAIDCSLSVYHGTDEAVLQVGVGHIEGSSLPVGGKGTHCVLSGHRGLPSARLLTNLDKVVVGDVFMLQTLGQCLTYQVDQIRIVEPTEIAALDLEEGEDYCTLVTCTPYGINSHRLLVRGRRIENLEEPGELRVAADASQIDPVQVAAVVAVPLLVLLMLCMLFTSGRKKR